MSRLFNVAIVGATGVVGEQIRLVLEERKFPVKNLKLLGSERSAGEKLRFNGKDIIVEKLVPSSFNGVDIGLFSAGAPVSYEFVPVAVNAGAVVVDNTSAFRQDPDIPLVVPEVNPEVIAQYRNKGIIANPNCSTIQMVVALKPLHDAVPIKRVVVSTYQAVSGAGRGAMKELADQSMAIFNFKETANEVFPHRIAFNCLPQIDVFLENLYTKEEMKMVNETRKIMNDENFRLTATTVRVPVFTCHSEAINIEFTGPMDELKARNLLGKAPGVTVLDDPLNKVYPMVTDAANSDQTYVGRIRNDETVDHGINLWCVADNLRKGAATNTVQIGEILAEKYL